MVETANKSKLTLIIALGIMFVSLTVVPMVFYTQINTATKGLEEALERMATGQERANVRGNITTDLILSSIDETRELGENRTQEDNLQTQAFFKYMEAESEDMDEELDDLRNITIALADAHDITIPDSVRDDEIIFENGVITFDNGTKVGIENILGER